MSSLQFQQSLHYRFACLLPDFFRRKVLGELRQSQFAVISNNCWGSHIYQRAAISYMTPFVGVAMSPDSYLDLLENWDLLGVSLRFTESSWDDSIERIRQKRKTFWPIGVLGERVEIQFMHEPDCETAKSKWERRLQRIPEDRNRIFLKFDDFDCVNEAQARRFFALNFPNKVFFTASKELAIRFLSAIYIPTSEGKLPDGLTLSKISPLYFDSAAWVSGRPQPRLKWFSMV